MDIRKEFEYECRLIKEKGIKDNPYRKIYEEEVRALAGMAEEMRKQCCTPGQIAKRLHGIRRAMGKETKMMAPPLFREYIFYATEQKYGDPLGPTFEQLLKKKTFAQIIESASRPIEDLDERLTLDGFVKWFKEVKLTGEG